jgi:hypothetical protein
MPNNTIEAGNATRVTVSGVTTMGNGNPCNMIGIFVPSVLTGQIVNLFTQTGNAILTGLTVIGTCTLAANTFYRIPAYFPKGITHIGTTEDVDLTIFWNPAA